MSERNPVLIADSNGDPIMFLRMKTACRRIGFIALAVFTVLVWLPLAGVVVATCLSTALGCTVDETTVHHCLFFGADIGPALYSAFALGWLMLVTGPFMFTTAVIWIGLLCTALLRRYRGR